MRKQSGLNNEWIKKMCNAGPRKGKEAIDCEQCKHLDECSEYVKNYYETLF